MLKDLLVPEYSDDVNDAMVKQIDDSNPIIVFGCGMRGGVVTELLSANGKMVDVYCESKGFWFSGKKYLGRDVIDVEDVPSRFGGASMIVAATGAEVFDILNTLFADRDKWAVYSFVDRNQQYTMTPKWVIEHADELDNTYKMLADDISQKTFLSYIGARANCIRRDLTTSLLSLWTSRQYFNDLYPKNRFEEHVLVDCGAWIGDTAEDFIKFIGEPAEKVKVRAFEMDEKNFRSLSDIAEKYGNIDCFHCGVGEKEETMYFESNESATAIVNYVTDNKVEIIPVDKILKDEKGQATFIKMDIEGYERRALLGMRQLIKRNMPMLAICVYHRIDDLIAIPQMIHDIEQSVNGNTGYRYYLRHHSHNAAELVFYAVPYTK